MKALELAREVGGVKSVSGDEANLVILAFGYRDDPHMKVAFEMALRSGEYPLLVEACQTEVTIEFT